MRIRQGPLWTGVTTLALVALMACMPNTAPQAGDHESTTCGNAFTIEMDGPASYADDYYERQLRICQDARASQIAGTVTAGLVGAVVTVGVAFFGRTRRQLARERAAPGLASPDVHQPERGPRLP